MKFQIWSGDLSVDASLRCYETDGKGIAVEHYVRWKSLPDLKIAVLRSIVR